MGSAMGDTAAGVLKDGGLSVVMNQSFDATTIKDMSPTVLKMKSAGVNVVIATQFPGPGKLFWDSAKTLDFNPIAACGTGGYEGTSSILTDQGAAGVDGFLSSNFPVENTNPDLAPGAAKFVETYKAKYNAQHLLTCHSLSGYTGMLFLLDALKRTQNLDDPESIRTAILATDIAQKTVGNGWGCQFSTAQSPYQGMTGQNTRVFDVGVQWQEGQMWTMFPVAYPGRTLQLPMKTWAQKKA